MILILTFGAVMFESLHHVPIQQFLSLNINLIDFYSSQNSLIFSLFVCKIFLFNLSDACSKASWVLILGEDIEVQRACVMPRPGCKHCSDKVPDHLRLFWCVCLRLVVTTGNWKGVWKKNTKTWACWALLGNGLFMLSGFFKFLGSVMYSRGPKIHSNSPSCYLPWSELGRIPKKNEVINPF